MTELAVITPRSIAGLKDRPYSLFFANYALTDYEYRNAWGDYRGFKVMDCLIHERQPSPSPEELLAVAKDLMPDIVIIPDALYNREQTVEQFKRYSDVLSQLDRPLMGVPQGLATNISGEIPLDWLKCFEELPTAYIGLHPGLKNVWKVDRGSLARQLASSDPGLKFHMLGLPKTGFDFEPAEYILGCDSARPFYQGVVGQHIVNRPQYYMEWQKWLIHPHWPTIRASILHWDNLLSATTTVSQELAPLDSTAS